MFRKVIVLAIFFLIIGSKAFAQAPEKKTLGKKFWVVNGLFVSSGIYDVESTFYVRGKCPACGETNPFMRPFVEAGKPETYAIIAATDIAVVYSSYYLKKHNSKLWFVFPVVLTASHVVAGTYNIRLAMKF